MSHLLTHAVRRRRRAPHDQDGYILMFVLGIIAMTSVVVVALLGLALTSARVASQEAELARETRAADGGLEAAVAKVAAADGDPCDALGGPSTVPFAGSGISTMPVQVACTISGTPGAADAQLPGPDVEIVGAEKYQGGIAAPTVTGVSDPALVVTGSQPLAFNSDVAVRTGAAPERTDGGHPAIDVAGQYVQGSSVGASGCGALGQVGINQVLDNSGDPACGAATSVSAVVPASVAGVPQPATRDLSCGSGRVELEPGRYTPSQVQGLNDLLGGTAPCTVIFKPGVHYLDVFDPRPPRTGAARFVLGISNPNVLVIGGVPRNTPVTGADFPRACRSDAGSDGVQIILSARSAFRHTGGRVALCPRHAADGTSLAVVVQSGTIEEQPTLAGVNPIGQFQPYQNLATGSSSFSTASLCQFVFFGEACPAASFTTTWNAAGAGPLRSARLLVDQQQRPYILGSPYPDDPASFHSMTVSVRFTVTSGALTCTTDLLPAGRAFGDVVAYDLLTGSCKTSLLQQEQLNGAVVTGTYVVPSLLIAPWTGLDMQLRNVRLEANSFEVAASAPGSSDAAWTGVDNALTFNGSAASVDQGPELNDPSLRWEDQNRVTRTIALDGLKLPTGLGASDRMAGLDVVVRSPSTGPVFLADAGDGGQISFAIVKGGSTLCVSTPQQFKSYAQSNQELRYNLIQGGSCGALATAGDVGGASLRVSITTGCTVPQPPAALIPAGKCASVAIPKLDFIGLSIRTDVNTVAPPPSIITVATEANASFDAFGPVLLPTTDLDIYWNGAHFSRPIFGDRLQVHGLGSAQGAGGQVGIVCCTIREGAAVLQATVDGSVRAQAVIQVDPDESADVGNRRAVKILDWKLCGRGGC